MEATIVDPAERAATGKEARSRVKRSRHREWRPPRDRQSPVDLLLEQDATRVSELVPIRHGRMLVSPFTFYRGSAALMAYDLASTPSSGLKVQLCGDAHLSNFGAFEAPDRRLVFDCNDFDETLPGPFEWDVKRLAASIAIAGRDRRFDGSERRDAVTASVRQYREEIRRFAAMRHLDVWYARIEIAEVLERYRDALKRQRVRQLEKGVSKAMHKDSLRALGKLTRQVNGAPRIISDPPLIVPIEELFPDVGGHEVETQLSRLLDAYRRTLPHDRQHLADGYRYVDAARKVVGVGSVGTRAWIILMLGRDSEDPLFLQAKEADSSVLEPYAGKSRFNHHGRRVVEGQRLMQAASDIFLGWIRNPQGLDGVARDFYVRQLWDWKTSVDIETIRPLGLQLYAQMCGWTIARAHARSGDRIAIASYLGKGDVFEKALADFAVAYADLNERDYNVVVKAVRDGRITAEEGV
jgi:uncharacterized protein (DUF2252 family)